MPVEEKAFKALPLLTKETALFDFITSPAASVRVPFVPAATSTSIGSSFLNI